MPNPIYLRSNGAVDSSITDLIQTFETKTISSDSITFTASAATLDTQGGASTDNLKTIVATNAQVGDILIIRSTSATRRIVIKHETGNIWSAGGDITLGSPRQLLMLIYDGAYWIAFGCCGSSTEPPEVDPDPGEELKCIIATRVTDFIELILGDVADALAGGVVGVASALTTYFTLVGATASPSRVLALANLIVSEYEDDAALEADFTEGVFASANCYLYCAKGEEDTLYTSGDLSTLQDFLGTESGAAWGILSEIFAILGADGMTNAIATGVLVASEAACSSGCTCSVAFEWESSASPTLEGCTAYVNIVLRIDGDGALGSDIDVDITLGGTATPGGLDYNLVTPTVTFPAGSVDGDTQTVEVEIVSDGTSDDNETIILGLDPDDGAVGGIAAHTLTILPGGCSKTWSKTFTWTVSSGMQGWSLLSGNLTNSGIQTTATFYYTAEIELALTIPHSSTFDFIQYIPCYGLAANRQTTISAFGTVDNWNNTGVPNFLPGNCVGGVGFSGLGVTRESGTINIFMGDNQAPNNGYINGVILSGTGINPFTGT